MRHNESDRDYIWQLIDKLKGAYYHNSTENLDMMFQGERKVMSYIDNENRYDITPSEISSALNMTGGRIAGLLKTLEKKNYIIRQCSETDRRKSFISLTESGKHFVEEHYDHIYTLYSELIERLGKEKTENFVQGLICISDINSEYQNRRKG